MADAATYLQMPMLPGKEDVDHPFYNYTSGRWLYNEQMRRAERHLVFNVVALLEAIAESVNKPVDSISNFSKIAEGGSFRVFEAVFSDGFAVIVRLPYPCTIPRSFGIASEAATMQFLRLHGIPIPRLFAWASSAANPVGSEYMIMAKVEGRELEHTWHTMTVQERMTVVKNIVDVERKLFQIKLPTNGSLYHKSFLASQETIHRVPLTNASPDADEFCIGPSSGYLWWHAQRDKLAINRGPWAHPEDAMRSVGERELAWLESFAKPRFPREPLYKAFYGQQKVDPEVQKQSLRDFLTVVPFVVPEQAKLSEPTVRHPDLSPNNIFVSNSGDITGLIDWQHTSVLPLFLQAKIPKHFQNWGDEDSENLRPPRLPEKFDDLPASEKDVELETYRRRQLHYFYVGYTRRNNETHFRAISKPDLVMTNKLFDTAARPWEGDNTSLKAEIIKASKYWSDTKSFHEGRYTFPVQYSEEDTTQCLTIDEKQQEADTQMQTLRDCFTINIDGWVPTDLYNLAKARADEVLKQMIEAADTNEEKEEVKENWPFQNHVEID